jgi:squalene synthase HpnC
VEGPVASHGEAGVTGAHDLASGKGHRDENFPVASFLIAPKHRPAIFAFYRFARSADDVADNPHASEDQKLALLGAMRDTLVGDSDADPAALALREVLASRSLSIQHGLDLLEAFTRDVTKLRYASWDDLMDYCRYSAAPVGRMVLDVHGESRSTWPANDALCAALQIINHLQDCAEDRRNLDRVYLPQDALRAAGASVTDLDAPRASPGLGAAIAGLARQVERLLERSRPFADAISDPRLALEVAFIQRIAEDLAARLARQDPLSRRVRHRKWELAGLALSTLARRVRRPPAAALDRSAVDAAP